MFKKLRRKLKRKIDVVRFKKFFALFERMRTDYYPEGWKWIDRFYIEDFLQANKEFIKGDILEFKDNLYAGRFGYDIKNIDIMTHPSDDQNTVATVFGDISEVEALPAEKYDCIICTQVLPFIYDFEKGIEGLKKMLKPQGIILLSVPGLVALVATQEMKETGHFWGFSGVSMRKAFAKYFKDFTVKSYGNAKAAMVLMGMGSSDLLSSEMLLEQSNDHIVTVCVRATK